uniref:Uncharacterized protein n=1 Tax=Arundo donax TaxID=35708 RepID=A0A0A8XWA7_ARUDO
MVHVAWRCYNRLVKCINHIRVDKMQQKLRLLPCIDSADRYTWNQRLDSPWELIEYTCYQSRPTWIRSSQVLLLLIDILGSVSARAVCQQVERTGAKRKKERKKEARWMDEDSQVS